jgi:glycosyltransferase involved in cell wall biosynthesis
MESTEQDIICIAQPSWDGNYTKSTVMLMKALANRHRVLYVDYAATWKDLITALVKGSFGKVARLIGLANRLRLMVSNKEVVAVLTLPPMLPLNFLPPGKLYGALSKINGELARLSIRKAMKRLNINKPIVINAFAPGLGIQLLDNLREKATIYYCYDEISQARWSSKHGTTTELIYSQKVNAIVVSSEALSKEKSTYNKNTSVVKNGVDFNIFQKGREIKVKETVPVIGFVGSLDDRVDYDLLENLIVSCPEYLFKFIGRVTDSSFGKIKALPNVNWMAPIPYEQLPVVISQFDVGIIPFVKSRFTEKIYPLKINEYLAMGKPVVMTSFAHLPEFVNIVEMKDDPLSFKEAIGHLIETDSEEKMKYRREVAKKNSWEERANEFCKIIDQLTCEKE